MPLLRLQLSLPLPVEKRQGLMKSLSSLVAGLLRKPESYMMVVLEPDTPMLMSGSTDPSALAEVRSVGSISDDLARHLAAEVSKLVSEVTGIARQRIYTNFAGWPAAMWGQGEDTFG